MLEPQIYRFEEPNLGLKGWLVVDSISQGLAFGGTRFSVDVTEDEVVELARCMSWKLAVHGTPVGGAKAGLRCDPTHPELPKFLASFGRAFQAPLRSHVLIGKDLGATNAMLDAIYRAVGVPQMHVVQARFGGQTAPNLLRELTGYQPHMTGLGIAWAVQALKGQRLDGLRVCIQGFGAVGAGAAVRLSELGARVVGVSDAFGAYFNNDGFDIEGLQDSIHAGGQLAPEGCARARREDLFDMDADILVLGAASHSVTETLAARIQTPLVVEGANFGLTGGARAALKERDVLVIPDILANSSSAAMVALQMASGNQYSASQLWLRIQESMQRAVCRSMQQAQADDTTLRQAWISSVSGPEPHS